MSLTQAIDDHFLERYRGLLDAEDTAFDGLEHAYEDGDRAAFESYLHAWEGAVAARLAELGRAGFKVGALSA